MYNEHVLELLIQTQKMLDDVPNTIREIETLKANFEATVQMMKDYTAHKELMATSHSQEA